MDRSGDNREEVRPLIRTDFRLRDAIVVKGPFLRSHLANGEQDVIYEFEVKADIDGASYRFFLYHFEGVREFNISDQYFTPEGYYETFNHGLLLKKIKRVLLQHKKVRLRLLLRRD